MNRLFTLALPLVLLAGCQEDDLAGLPPAVTMPADAVGHYCQMVLAEHPGPKAQVLLDGEETPLFFSQVRDAISYQRMPEQSHAITAIYVNDMAAAPSWEEPGADNWIAAGAAHFVVGSTRVGGMGAAELVPFSDADTAAAFAAEHGGRVERLDGIADHEVLSPEETPQAHDGHNFMKRLERVSQERES